MTDFVRMVKLIPGFDYRDDPVKSDRGCHPASLVFATRGPMGAISAEITTGWQSRPLAVPFQEQMLARTGHVGPVLRPGDRPRMQPFDRRTSPGVDAMDLLDGNSLWPLGAGVYSHAPEQRETYWRGGVHDCPWLDGQKCWGEVSYVLTNDFLDILVRDGSDVAFDWLETEIYPAWLPPEVVSE